MCLRGGHVTEAERGFNARQRRIRVVVENTIGQVKKWRVIGTGKFRHHRDLEPAVFELCAKLTARLMRVRDKYPRSKEWLWKEYEEWEAKLGVFLILDNEDPQSHLVHNLGADMLYNSATPDGRANVLQHRWNVIWGLVNEDEEPEPEWL